MEIKNHFGVYAVCFENGKLLCIEGLTETLTREVMEETGFSVRSYSK